MKRKRFRYWRLFFAAFTTAALSFSPGARSAVVTWVGADASFWDIASNWSSNPAFPGAADDVALGAFNTTFRTNSGTLTIQSFTGTGTLTVTGGTLTFANASSIGGFSMSGGQLTGTGNLTINGAATLTDAAFAGAGTTTVKGATAISGLALDGGRIFQNDDTVTQTGTVDLNVRNLGTAQAGNGAVLNAAGATWNSNFAAGVGFITASSQVAGDTGAGATFTNAGTFNKLGAGTTDVRVNFVNNGSIDVQAGQLQFSSGGAFTQNGSLTISAGATLDFASGNTVTHTINTSSTTIAGTISLSGNNFVNFTTAHTVSGTGTWQHDFGQVIGANLTFGPSVTVNLVDGTFSGPGTTTVQGTTMLINTGLRLDGGRIFRNEGLVTQTANVDLNSRRSGAVEAGNGTVVNAVGAIWSSNISAGTNFIFASSQGAGDTGAGATFTNLSVFNKQGAGLTDVRAHFVNDGQLNVEAGQLQFSSGGRLTHNGALTIAADAVLDFASANTITQTINPAATTIAGTLSITGDNFVNFTTPHTISGSGTFQHTFGQVTGANLTLGPQLAVVIGDGSYSGAATTTVQGNTTIQNLLRLDGGRIFRNEGTVTQTASASVDLNSRRAGAAEPGNGTVVNVGTWDSTIAAGINSIFASSQGVSDTGAGAVFTNAGSGTFNKQGAGSTNVLVNFINNGSLNVQGGELQFSSGGTLTHNGALTIAAGATLDFAGGNTITQTINTAATTIAGTLSITGDNFVNFTTPHTISGSGTFQHTFGQVTGANLTLGPQLAVVINDGSYSGVATTTVQGNTTIQNLLRLDGGRIFRNEGTVTQTASANVDLNSRRSGAAEAGNGTVVNVGTWNSNIAAGINVIFANSQGAGDTGAGATFTNATGGIFSKQGGGNTNVQLNFINNGSVNVQAGELQFSSGGTLTHNGALALDAGATLDFASANTITHTINTAATTIAGTMSITGDNFVNFTTPHTISGTGTFQHTFGHVTGASLTLGPQLALVINDGTHTGAATTTVQGNTTIQNLLRLDGGRIFRNEGTVSQTGNVDLNSRRSGTAEPGNGTVVNAGTWNAQIAVGINSIFASSQGAGDTGAGATFTNAAGGTFNKEGAGITNVLVNFINNGSLNVQGGELQFSSGGTLTHSGSLSIAAGATLDFIGGGTITQTINTAATTIAGTLSITGDNFVNFTTPHTISGIGTFQHTFGHVTGANLTLGPQLAVVIGDGTHTGAATTTAQGNTTIQNLLRLDGGRIFRNEGTVTQTATASVDLNSRRAGAAEAGNGTVVNAGTWNSQIPAGINSIFASSQGVGDTGAGATFTNASGGTFNKEGAGITDVLVNFNNSGLADVQAGTLILRNGIQGTGTLQTSGGIADVRAASTTGNLFHNTNAPDSLILGTNNITVSNDYNNANFGVGNAFNPRANVSGTGQILASGNVAQAITGANVTNGTSTTPALTIGSMHAGTNTFNFQIQNTGTTGPSLRGAIQTAANGGNITDPQISIAAQNWGPVSPGGSTGNIAITINAVAGPLSLQPNQQLHIANNFANVNSQNLIITLGQNAAVYNLAQANVTPSPVTLPNQRVGGILTQALTVANTAPAGAFTETLSASFGTNTGNAINTGGSIAGLAGGASNNTAMQVGVNASTAGARTGTVTVNLTSNAVAGSGLSNTVLTPQVITVSGNVYQAAIGQLNPPIGLNFGTVQVGQVVTQNLSISNIATGAAGFVEDLNARFGTPNGTGAAQIVGTGSITGLAAGAPANTSSMVVSVNTGTAGTINGFIPINFFTAGTVNGQSNGLGEAAANSASFGVTGVIQSSGQVVNQANPVINTAQPINLGNVRINAASPTAFVSVTNQATTPPQAALNASIATASPGIITASGAFNLLLPGETNANSLQVGMVTTSAGAKSGTAAISFVSDASNIGNCAPNCQLPLQSQNVSVTGNVFRLATGNATPEPVNLGNFRLTTPSATASLAVVNTAAADGFSEQLGIQSVTPSSALFTATNALGATRVNPQGTANNAISIGLGTGLAAGLNTGSVAIQYLSDGTASGTGTPINSNLQNVAVSATGFNVAAGSATPDPVTIANQRIGGTNVQTLTVSNTAPPGIFTEALNASFGANTGNATNNGGTITGGVGSGGVAGGASNNTAMSVGVNTNAAGARTGTVTVNYASNGVDTSGLPTIGAGSQQITVSGNVYQLAAGTLNTAPLNFGTVQVGQAMSQTLSITNSAVGPIGFVEDLNARFGTATGTGAGAISGTGQVSNLAAGATNASNMVVTVNTGSAQTISGSIPVNFFSAGAVNGASNGLGEVGVGSVQYAVSGVIEAVGQVVNQANPVINTAQPINLGNVRINTASPTAFVSVTNQATTPPQAALNASIATASPGVITATGAFNLLLPGETNANALQVGMVTTSAGAKSGTAAISFVSDASNIGNCAPNCQLPLQSQNVTVTGNVFRLATGNATPDPLNLGNFRLTTPNLTGSLAVTNTAAADGSSEQLGIQSVTPTSALFTATNALGATRVNAQATANNAISVGLGTGLVAGVNTAAVAIQYLSDGAASGTGAPINSNLQNVAVSATGFNVAAGNATPSPATIANQRIGGTNSQVLTVRNTAPAGIFTEALNASFGANTGNATNNAGTITGGIGTGGVAGGALNNAAMSVGVDTSAAGARTGTVTLNYSSNGLGSSGLGTIGAGSQQITVNGNVYQLAAGTLNTAPLNFGTVQVGQAVSQTLSITNSAVGPIGFVEDLNARFGTATGTGAGAISGTGQVSNLAAGATNASNMVVTVNTGSAQTINGSIPVNFFSAGAVNGTGNGLAEVGVGSVQYAVSGVIQAVGQVVNQANPVINTAQPVNLGNVRINAASPTAFVSVTNQATTPPQAALNASISAAPPITASGSFNLLAPGATNSNALQVGMQTNTAGAVNGLATVSFVSDAANIGNCAPNCQVNLPSQNVAVSGNVYRLADPVLNTAGVALVARVGDVGPVGAISVTNSSPDAFTEGLKATLGAAPAGFTGSGSIANLPAGATDASTLKATLNTAVAGTFGGPLNVSFVSTGEGTTGAPDVGAGSAPVNLSGKVYAPAVAQIAPAVDFGIVHKGEVVATRNVTVANIALVSGLNDALIGSFGGAASPFTASGNLAGVAAGATDSTSFNVALNTASAGIFTGSGTATLASRNGDMADLALGTRTVALAAQVNNFANAAVVKSGGEGALNRSGQTFSLDLGTLIDDSGIHAVTLGVLNDVLGPADLLAGNFDLGLNDDFQVSGFNAFAGLEAGRLQDGLVAALDTDLMTVGTYVDRIILRSIGSNASGFSGALEDIVIELRGNIIGRTSSIPEPGTLALLVLGMLIFVVRMLRIAR